MIAINGDFVFVPLIAQDFDRRRFERAEHRFDVASLDVEPHQVTTLPYILMRSDAGRLLAAISAIDVGSPELTPGLAL